MSQVDDMDDQDPSPDTSNMEPSEAPTNDIVNPIPGLPKITKIGNSNYLYC